jgi:CubicO group peptidase (beta-lactamase class C family)
MTDRIAELLRRGAAEGVFSGAAWSVGTADAVWAHGSLGTVRRDGGAAVSDRTLWDLASVTKPIVGMAVLSLVESGHLLLDDPVARYVDAFHGSDKAPLTVRQLLTHTSGLPGEVPLYRWCPTRDRWLEAARELPLRFRPGRGVEYSSLGFVLLGLVAEAAGGAPLDELVAERVTGPLGMMHTAFLVADRENAAATERCPWRGRLVQGEVHDENAVVLGRPSGHAGLFASLTDMARLAAALARGSGGPIDAVLGPATLAAMVRPATDALGLRRCLAWQGRDAAGCPAGDLAGPASYGHTGFTGTSIWIDPQRQEYVVLLTNRVHPTRADRGFTRVRALMHNAAFGCLGSAGDALAPSQRDALGSDQMAAMSR